MNKLKYIFLLMIIMYTTNVYAFSITMNGDTKMTSDSEVTVTVGVSGANNLWGFKSSISYDSSKITLSSYNGINGFGVAVGTSLVADSSSGKNGIINVATLTFKATNSFKEGETTTISLGSAEGSDGENIIKGSGSSHKITMIAPLSSNNTLTSLSVSPTDIKFNKNTKTYNLTVEISVTSINIKATQEE